MPPAIFEPLNCSKQAAADARLRLRGHWDRLFQDLVPEISIYVHETYCIQQHDINHVKFHIFCHETGEV
jgi:hypothetical protein